MRTCLSVRRLVVLSVLVPPARGSAQLAGGAIGAFYRDHERMGHAARARAFEEAMARVSAQSPEDREGLSVFQRPEEPGD